MGLRLSQTHSYWDTRNNTKNQVVIHPLSRIRVGDSYFCCLVLLQHLAVGRATFAHRPTHASKHQSKGGEGKNKTAKVGRQYILQSTKAGGGNDSQWVVARMGGDDDR